MSESEVLRRVLDAIVESGNLKRCAYAVAERRRWSVARDRGSGMIDWFTTTQRWTANLSHMLDPQHRYSYGLLDHRRVCGVLGFDPLSDVDFDRAA